MQMMSRHSLHSIISISILIIHSKIASDQGLKTNRWH